MGPNRGTTVPDRPTDVGIAAVEHMYKLWQIDEEWSVRDSRSFTWWGGDFRQRIHVDSGHEENGLFVYQLFFGGDRPPQRC
jgi:hypothetical protein